MSNMGKDGITLVQIKNKDLRMLGTSELFRNTYSSLTPKKANENTDFIHKIRVYVMKEL